MSFRLKTIYRCFGIFVACSLTVLPAFCESKDKPQDAVQQEPPQEGKRPLVVMKQAEIKGKVLLLQEEEDVNDPPPKKGISIQIRTLEDDRLIYKTVTDDTGSYTLPDIDVGKYRFVVGRLKLELSIESLPKEQGDAKQIPKTIVVLIPVALRG